MDIQYLDSHCHVNDETLLPRADEVIKAAFDAGVKTLLFIGWDLPSSRLAVELAQRHEGCYAAVGFHPENLDGISPEALAQIKALAQSPKVIAIGEIGLDYHWFKEPEHRQKQKEWFIKQIDLANELNLPVSIHSRDASFDTLSLLAAHPAKAKGVLHCYSGSVETMKELLKLGYYFGFDGPITFKNAKEPKACVAEIPLDRLLCETDSPYLAPTPFRGSVNEPKNVPLIVEAMAEIKGIPLRDIAAAIQRNFENLFRVKL